MVVVAVAVAVLVVAGWRPYVVVKVEVVVMVVAWGRCACTVVEAEWGPVVVVPGGGASVHVCRRQGRAWSRSLWWWWWLKWWWLLTRSRWWWWPV